MFQHFAYVMSLCFYAGTAVAFTNLASGTTFTEFNAASNRRADAYLHDVDECRCEAGGGVNGAGGTLGEVRYSLDAGATLVSTPLVTCPADAMTTLARAGTWQTVPAAAKTDVVLAFGLSHGDGAADPTVGSFRMECRKR